MGGGTTSQDTQSQSISQIPQWMQQAGQQNYAYAQDVANRPLQQYQGQMVADVAPQTQQAWNVAAQSPSVGQDQYQGATAGFLNSLGQTPANVIPQTLAGTNLAPYMNPFTQSVINTTLPIMQQQLGQQQVGNQNQANAANAFGGSRLGVQQGVTQAQGAQNMAQMAAQLWGQNFGQAQAGATGDITRNLAAQQGNQQAQQAKIQSDILASQGLGNLGTSMNQANASNYGLLTSAGAGQAMQAQNQINSQMAKFQQANQYPQQQLATLLSALGMTPHDTSTTGQQTTTTTTPTDWASILTGGMQLASDFIPKPVPSDKRVKKNITSMGSDPITGVPIKSFNYKGQSVGAPKVVGPLAQDVEKAAPGSTVKVKGIMAAPASTLAAATPSVAHLPQHAANSSDTVPAMLSPGEAVLNRGAAQMVGRDKISKMNRAGLRHYARGTSFVSPPLTAFTPPSSPGVAKGISALTAFTPPARSMRFAALGGPPAAAARAALSNPRAGARAGGLANTKRKPSIIGALGGA